MYIIKVDPQSLSLPSPPQPTPPHPTNPYLANALSNKHVDPGAWISSGGDDRMGAKIKPPQQGISNLFTRELAIDDRSMADSDMLYVQGNFKFAYITPFIF